MKRCSKCGITQSFEDFYVSTGKPSSWCKDCQRAANRLRYERNKAEINLRVAKTARARRLGMTYDQYVALPRDPGEACSVCRAAPDDPRNCHWRSGDVEPRKKNLAIDHDHATGKIRGFLCSHCNRALGLMADDPSLLRKLAEYIDTGGLGWEPLPPQKVGRKRDPEAMGWGRAHRRGGRPTPRRSGPEIDPHLFRAGLQVPTLRSWMVQVALPPLEALGRPPPQARSIRGATPHSSPEGTASGDPRRPALEAPAPSPLEAPLSTDADRLEAAGIPLRLGERDVLVRFTMRSMKQLEARYGSLTALNEQLLMLVKGTHPTPHVAMTDILPAALLHEEGAEAALMDLSRVHYPACLDALAAAINESFPDSGKADEQETPDGPISTSSSPSATDDATTSSGQ